VALKLYNTLTRKKEPFKPLDAENVRMYVCGPTVYDFAHIGNARPVIVFDVLFRLLRHLYGADHVTYVRNVTDVDDKINARAAQDYPDLPLNEAIRKVTEKTEAQFHADVDALGCLPPTKEPRATEYIAQMKAMIEALVTKAFAYVAEDHVLFDVAAMKDYGKLSGRSLDEMIAGARVEVAPYKRDPMDFVLWKPSKPGEPSWPSPAGIKALGRPGWHIECSAMAEAHLGDVFDIHGGGIDLVFPHHENEIAQSRCAHGTKVMANYWVHNGFLQVEGEKMAKSLGNFVTIHELLTGWRGRPWPGSTVRWAMLQSHYRQPIDWSLDLLQTSTTEIEGTVNHLRGFFRDPQTSKVDFSRLLTTLKRVPPSSALIDALSDDLNTPEASAVIRANRSGGKADDLLQAAADLSFLGVIKERDMRYLSEFHGVSSEIDNKTEALRFAITYQVARANDDVMFASRTLDELQQSGLALEEREPSLLIIRKSSSADDFDESVRSRVAARNVARRAHDFAEADRIRDELAAMGVVLKDSKEGTTWEVAR
jgi:cysteinyl-tRNA synthetase